LKALNAEIQEIYANQQQQAEELGAKFQSIKEEHQGIIERDKDKIEMEEKLKALEKAFAGLKVEVEASAQQNEKTRLNKDERLAKDVNGKVLLSKGESQLKSQVLGERKNNEDLRARLRDIEEKRQQ